MGPGVPLPPTLSLAVAGVKRGFPYAGSVAIPVASVLSSTQLDTLRAHGEERRADVGDVLFRVGDRRYPFIAILEGEAAVLDTHGHMVVRFVHERLTGVPA